MTMARSFLVTATALAAAGVSGRVVEGDVAGGDAGDDAAFAGPGTLRSVRFVVAED
jgi:hypothetical protein